MYEIKNKLKIFLVFLATITFFLTIILIANYLNRPAKLNVSTSPSGAKVLIDNKEIGQSPITIKLKSGNYLISIKKEGYETIQDKKMTITNRDITENINLTKTYELPYSNNNYSIDCTDITDTQEKICDIAIYNTPVDQYKKEAQKYLEGAKIKESNKTFFIFDDRTSSNFGSIPG